jgi:hypothetical protein
LHLKFKYQNAVFCGKTVKRCENFDVEVSQPEAIASLEEIVLPKPRRADAEAALTPDEITEMRSGNGSLSWITRQSRGDMLIHSSTIAQQGGDFRVKHVASFNKAVKEIKDTADTKLIFKHVAGVRFEDLDVFSCADSSLGNVDDVALGEKTRSQCGHVTGLATKPLYEVQAAHIWPLVLHSGTIPRVVRSTLAAETNGVLEGAETADYLRSLVAECRFCVKSAKELSTRRLEIRSVWFTDAKSLHDCLAMDKGQCSDKRVRLLVAQLREMLAEDNTTCHWIDTLVMLADALTKVEAERGFLREALESGLWSPENTAKTLEAKQRIRDGRQRRSLERAAIRSAAKQPHQPVADAINTIMYSVSSQLAPPFWNRFSFGVTDLIQGRVFMS